MLNWNRINAVICFNYLQQEFYLVTPTMKTLATGKNQQAILKLLRVLISTCQGNYGDQNMDDEYIRDIADVIERDVNQASNLVVVMSTDRKRHQDAVLSRWVSVRSVVSISSKLRKP